MRTVTFLVDIDRGPARDVGEFHSVMECAGLLVSAERYTLT